MNRLPWVRWISDSLLEPFAPQVAIAVLGIQLAITVCLGTNVRVRHALWMIPATLVLPFATTLHLRDVIDDPALMLSFLGVAAAATTLARSYGVAQLLHVVASTRVGSWGFCFLDRFGVRFDVSVPELERESPGPISRPGGLS